MTYAEVIESLSLSIVSKFQEVYHSAEIVTTDDGMKFPAIVLGDEWVNLSPTDTNETIYIRRAGDDIAVDNVGAASCAKAYKMQTPIRIVFFRDHEQCPHIVMANLMRSVLIGNVILRSITRDKFKLQKEESSGTYTLGASTAYFAIDAYIIWHLLPDTCEESCVSELENPLCKQ